MVKKLLWIPVITLSLLTPVTVIACSGKKSKVVGHNDPSFFTHLDESFDLTNHVIPLRKAIIDSWIDGDTLKIHYPDDPSDVFNVRISLIDTPETHKRVHGEFVHTTGKEREWGDKATEFARKLLPAGSAIWFSTNGGKSYNRIVGSIFYGEDISSLKNYSISIIYNALALPSVSSATVVLSETNPLNIIGLSFADSYNYAFEKQLGLFSNKSVLIEHGITDDAPVRYKTDREISDAITIYDLWEDRNEGNK
ncbi:thermonuclease family protein [Candidatus Mycoplasma mahonii]|uniref:thermonuclease family protein n=1 Tax=Candidatus Mycoplasma mahonii TaxID=3004105 RepID=UPI0026EF1AD5|nr:thermonuclease family protein [Candidatus Mycoplasma mahonii]WKX02473.1 thermonuclease family protein [Candidatus Mycoplasma mahonii]